MILIICHFSVQSNNIHLLCEASGKDGLARGVQGFAISAARRLNRVLGRRGGIFADRYHQEILSTLRQARNALAYVLLNARRHGHHRDKRDQNWIDPFSSARYFHDWKSGRPSGLPPPASIAEGIPVAPPRTWYLTTGWRRHGLISPTETPGPRSAH